MKPLLVTIAFLILIAFQSESALANPHQNFEQYMQNWNEKKSLASKYLLEAEKQFKDGDELSGCATQQKAGEYGIEATQSLIKAMKANGSEDGMENLISGLNKWRELKDFC